MAKEDDARKADLKRRADAQREMDEAVPTPSQEEVDNAVRNVAAGRGAVTDAPPTDGGDKPAPRAASPDGGSATYRNRADKSA